MTSLPGGNSGGLHNEAAGIITVWSDIGCPWATLALHTLHVRAAHRGQTVLVDHRAFPVELFNGRPTPKVILDMEIVAIAGRRPDLGWQMWTGPESTYPVTMLPAMEAVQAAKAPHVGGLLASDQLDTALRRAFYVEGRCISVHSEILDVAAGGTDVDVAALAEALALGSGRREVYEQWAVARGPEVQGSPHVFTTDGYACHNPGVSYHWTAKPPQGFPFLDAYDEEWAESLLDQLSTG
ncbi:MAG: dithiol-disulfide isomerase [Actinomycetota bacterium]|nr:dithiol-disulfide isomerase [Actinomycetota bacterium]